MSPRRPPAPGSGGIGDPTGGPRAPRTRAGGSGAAAKKQTARPASAQERSAAAKLRAEQARQRTAEAKKRAAAAARAQTQRTGSPISRSPGKGRTRTTASRSGGLRPTGSGSTRPGSARPRAGSTGRGQGRRGIGIGNGRPVWVLGGVMAVLALLILPYFQKWLVQRSELESARAEVSQAQDDVTALKKQQERWKDDDYVRAQARSRLNYVMPGETGYVVSDPTPTADSTPQASAEADVPDGNRSWYSGIWLSAQAAGAEGQAQATTQPTTQPTGTP
ncbi:septum formation initiator family protein [Kineosporia sp. J2-2]|uniref:Septum formation initiator family protein n=1 Tax=Kineosporia corallincola TaxID=2835133 RepID=A0ABS5TI42_9ACTN|nr:septum formation initiator family protein [Kineosporia corallincola]MBT0770528.1 septum formation initiator family protein [Kineosporia corallincola]